MAQCLSGKVAKCLGEQVFEFEVPHCFDEFVGLGEALLFEAVAYGDDSDACGFGGGDASG